MASQFSRLGEAKSAAVTAAGVSLAAMLCSGPALSPLSAQEANESAPRLGTVDFPTSGSPEAQQHFLIGLLYLHSFEYGPAAAEFRKAQELDPDFAMAYWGEAMTHNHPLWKQRDREAAIAALEQLGPTREARLALAPTERERFYLEAAETLWAEGPKAERDTAYMRAMRRVADAFPDDPDAQAFYALSLLGLSDGVRVIPTYMRAAAIVEEVIDRYPEHPGAAHYMIHSYDDPIHAPLGLRAARAYSAIAPDAAHAQHMTSHIFLALGMWEDVVSQNTIAAGLTGWGPGHYTAWLGYGLEQQGRYDDARAHLERAFESLGAASRPSPRARSYMLGMRADYLVNTRRWSDPVIAWEVDPASVSPIARAKDAFALGYAALRRGDRPEAERQLARLRAIVDGVPRASYVGNPDGPVILALELEASLSLVAGAADAALSVMRNATALEDAMPLEYGPPDVVKPSHELLGEMLLQVGEPAAAALEFRRALELAPLRALALLGLGRAAAEAGEDRTALRAYRDLLAIWSAADPDIEGAAEARSFLSARTSE
jgi:tetratricopeptide (TPR) repeat protein